MTTKPDITIITPTGDRPASMRLCEKWVARQSTELSIEHLIVDDGETPYEPIGSNIRYVRREPSPSDPGHTLTVNLLAAIDAGGHGDKVMIFEDDDYYAPGYVAHYAALLEDYDLVGEGMARYYGLSRSTYHRHKNEQHASLAQTGLRSSMLPVLREVTEQDINDPLIDLRLWKRDARKHVFTDPEDKLRLHAGIKGVPGRPSPVKGNQRIANGASGKTDDGLRVLSGWMDREAFDIYRGMMAGAPDMHRVAVVGQGPSAAKFPGSEGFDAVIGVNGIPTRIACTHWYMSDHHTFGKWVDRVIGRPEVVLRQGKPQKMKNTIPEDYERLGGFSWRTLDSQRVPQFDRKAGAWNRTSGPGALALAWALGAREVVCYGCDMAGESDVHGGGPQNRDSRSESRWDRERAIWSSMVRAMRADGVKVQNVNPDAEVTGGHESSGEPTFRRWTYRLRNGEWSTVTFDATGELDFRRRLNRMLDPVTAAEVDVKEVG